MNKILFLDLDETLIHAEWNNFHNKKRTRVDFTNEVGDIVESYGVILRPGTQEFLRTVRSIYSKVYMLTAATYEYGVRMNNVFSLGFNNSEIIGRENWYYDYIPIIHDPTTLAVLGDNQSPIAENARGKLNYLNKQCKGGYVTIRPFYGHVVGEFTPKLITNIVAEFDKEFERISK